MKPIDYLEPKSKLKVWLMGGFFDRPKQIAVVLQKAPADGRPLYDPASGASYAWKDVGETPREALEIYIANLTAHRIQMDLKIGELEALLRREYPRHPVLSEEEFARRYSHLEPRYRLMDFPEEDLRRLNAVAHQHSQPAY